MKTILALRIFALLLLGSTCARGGTAFADWVRRDPQNRGVIIFVHGVLGSGRSTWTSTISGAYWPKMLTHDHDFDGQNIYVFDYKSNLADALTIDELADNMRVVLNANGVLREDQLTFVSHSMGGIVTREFILSNRDLAKKIRFLYFFGTPADGNSYAHIGDFLGRNPQFGEILPIKQDGDRLLARLIGEWHSANFTFPSYCAYETQPTYGQIIVDLPSASNLCGPITPIEANHEGMVKPKDRKSDSYLALKEAFDLTKPPPRSPDPQIKISTKRVPTKTTPAQKESLADRTTDLSEEIERWVSKQTLMVPRSQEQRIEFGKQIAEYHRIFDPKVNAIVGQLEGCQVNTAQIKTETEAVTDSAMNLVPIYGVSNELKSAGNAIPEGQPKCGTGQPIQGFGIQKSGLYFLELGSSSSGAYKRDLQRGRKSALTTRIGDYSSSISVYLNGGVFCVDATIFRGIGFPAINVVCNRVSAPPGWDTNFTDKAMEIVDQHEVPMFQVVFEDARRVRVNGFILVGPNKYNVFTPYGVTHITIDPNNSSPIEVPLKRLFKYPAWQHLGEYAN